MTTHAPKLSKKQSTVLLGDVLKQMGIITTSLGFDFIDLKDERGKIIDLIVRTSHIWSERHPERAKETIDENCLLHTLENGAEFKGIQNTVMFSHMLHDVLEGTQLLRLILQISTT